MSNPKGRHVFTLGIPGGLPWLERAHEDKLRSRGRLRELVLRTLQRGETPDDKDVEAAMNESLYLPRELADYVALAYGPGARARKPGRKRPPRTAMQDLAIVMTYYREEEHARDAYQGAANGPRNVKTIAFRETAKRFSIGVGTVRNIVRASPWKPDNRLVAPSRFRAMIS